MRGVMVIETPTNVSDGLCLRFGSFGSDNLLTFLCLGNRASGPGPKPCTVNSNRTPSVYGPSVLGHQGTSLPFSFIFFSFAVVEIKYLPVEPMSSRCSRENEQSVEPSGSWFSLAQGCPKISFSPVPDSRRLVLMRGSPPPLGSMQRLPAHEGFVPLVSFWSRPTLRVFRLTLTRLSLAPCYPVSSFVLLISLCVLMALTIWDVCSTSTWSSWLV